MHLWIRWGVAVVLTVLLTTTIVAAQTTPPSAESVVAAAVKRAKAEGKVVLIEFGASWCIWCRHFETFVHAPETASINASQYVVVNLVVQERDDKVALEHPGGRDAMFEWGAANAGLPFYVFLDNEGRKIADSNAMPDGANIGFPAIKAEVEAFMMLIDRTAPKLSGSQRRTLETHLLRRVK